MPQLFILGFVLCASLCLDLGIVNVAIIRTGLQTGLKAAFLLGIGATIGDMVYVTLSASGMMLLLKISWVRWMLWTGGTIILAYWAWQMMASSFKKKSWDTEGGEMYRFPLWSGLSLALASPSSIIWFATVGGSVIATYSVKASSLPWFFGGFITANILWCLAVAWVSSKGKQFLNPKVLRNINRVAALTFLVLAVKVFLDGWKEFV